MGNLSHFVLWVRPSVSAGWSGEEVARCWLSVFGKRVNGPTDLDVAQAVGNAERIELWRGRLGDVIWFMRCLNEWLARKANAEDECTGRFWEGRFCCQLLEDEGAVLACMAYVDLNPVRAKMAHGLEDSRLTSVHDRLCAKRARLRMQAMGEEGKSRDGTESRKRKGKAEMEPTAAQARMLEEAREDADKDRWLCRFGGEREPAEGGVGDRDGRGPDSGKMPASDHSGRGAPTVLGMRFEDYLELLEWTGRCVAEGKQGSIPEAALPVLERLELDVENWVETVARYGSLYHRVAGKVENLKRKALEMGQQWVSGQRKSRGVFRRKKGKVVSV